MPIFTYTILNPDGSDAGTLEIEQSLQDAPLTHHPLNGLPLRRKITSAGLVTKHGEGEIKRKTRDSQELARLGFTRYERDKSSGRYYKTAGSDPNAPESFSKPKGNELLPHEDALIHGAGCACSTCRRAQKTVPPVQE